jgi:hypothetical protein
MSVWGANARVHPVVAKRTRLIAFWALWELSRSDLTLGYHGERRIRSRHWACGECMIWHSHGASCHPSGASGHHYLSAWSSWPLGSDGARLKKWHVTRIPRPNAGLAASDRSDRRVWSPHGGRQWEPNNSILWSLLFKPHGRLLLTLLAIFIDIAT